MSKINTVIPRVSKKQFSELYFNRNMPAIVTDAMSDWPDKSRWTPEYLSSLIGNEIVRVSVSESGKFNYDTTGKGTSDGFSEEAMSFSEAVERITAVANDCQYYIMQYSIPLHFPVLMKKITIPGWISDIKNTSINLWFGRNSVTPLHYDAANNFFMQMHGVKHFTIFSPNDMENLYPYPIESKMAHLSSVDLDNPDSVKHPNLSRAQAIQFEVHAGEMLYLPAFWWHQVCSPSISISVSIWWLPDLQQYIQAPNGTRKLYRQYEGDRLKSLKQTMLVSNNLHFVAAAKLLLGARQKWAACLLALAACDEFIGELCNRHGIQRASACTLNMIASELHSTLVMLASVGAFETGQPYKNAVEHLIALAGRIIKCSNDSFSDAEAESMIQMASLLEGVAQPIRKATLIEI